MVLLPTHPSYLSEEAQLLRLELGTCYNPNLGFPRTFLGYSPGQYIFPAWV